MKHVTFVLAMIVSAFVVGCQDNNTTNPIAGPMSGGKQISKTYSGGTIPLIMVLREPYGFNAFTEVSGQVTYSTSLISRDPVPPFSQWAVEVTLATDAVAKPFGLEEPMWRITGSSHDELLLDEDADGAMVLEKSYVLAGRNDGVFLHLQFQIAQQTVALSRMWLALPADVRQGDSN